MQPGAVTQQRVDVEHGIARRRPHYLSELWRFLPGLAVIATAIIVLRAGGVDVGLALRYGAYFVLAIVLPGTLVWRAIGPQLGGRLEEYAIGAALGYALEVPARLGASMLGVPAAGLLVPAAIVGAAILVPRWRRLWRSAAAPVGAAAGWAYAAICVTLLIWLWYSYFRSQPVTWTGWDSPMADLVFTLAFSSDVAHRWPVEYPWVAGQPLNYHWFIGLHFGQSATATGADLPTVLFRLYLVPMIPVLVVATGALAARLARGLGGWWLGPLAGFLALVTTELNLLPLGDAIGDPTRQVVDLLLGSIVWWSPTVTYAAVLAVPAALIVVDLVRGTAGRGHWFLLVLLTLALAGAKGTALPLFVGGLGLVLLIGLLATRRVLWRGAGALLVVAAGYLTADLFIYGGQSHGIGLDIFGYADATVVGAWVHGSYPAALGWYAAGAVTVLGVFAYLPSWIGGVLLLNREHRSDPAVWFLAGLALVGVLTMVLLYHPGQSQLHFLRVALPVLAAGGAWGIATQIPRLVASVSSKVPAPRLEVGTTATAPSIAATRRTAWIIALTLAAGAMVSLLVMQVHPARWSAAGTRTTRFFHVLEPYLLVIVAIVVISAGYAVVRRRTRSALPVTALAVAALLFAGAAAVRIPGEAVYATYGTAVGTRLPEPDINQQSITGDLLKAATWLRDNSAADDLVMTNVHCRYGPRTPGQGCDNLTFWVSGYSERRVLVEGWGYTARNAEMAAEHGKRTYGNYLPFWDEKLLERNDRFIVSPTRASARALQRDHDVRWLIADPAFGPVSPELSKILKLRYRAGNAVVYEFP